MAIESLRSAYYSELGEGELHLATGDCARGNSARPIVISPANVAPQRGGLAAYQRALARLALEAGYKAQLLAIGDGELDNEALEECSGVQTHHIRRRLLEFGTGRFAHRFAVRPSAHTLLEVALRVLGRSQLACIERQVPQVIHYAGTGWSLLGFALSEIARRCGAMFTVWPAVHPGNWGDDSIDIRFYNRADAVFCQSDYELRHLAHLGVAAGRLKLCGLPPMCLATGNGARLRAQLKIGSRPTVLFIGRRNSGKGEEALIEAWRRVILRVPDAVLLLAGPGDNASSIDARILPENIRDLGMPGEASKADALAACDVFCVPSAHESFGIVYVEAWSYGKPVICGTAPASRELIVHDHTGIHASQEVPELTEALVHLLTSPKKAHMLGAEGHRLQQSKYTPQAMLSAHLKVWQV